MADIRLNVQFGKKILNGFEIGISLPYYNLASIEVKLSPLSRHFV